jgi:hypothetical protein
MGDVELKLEFTPDGDGSLATFDVHPRCFRVLMLEFGRLSDSRALNTTDQVRDPEKPS